RQREWGTFVQDDIKLTSNLTLHAGLRWDYYGVPYEGDGRIGEVTGGSSNLFGISGSTLADLFHPGVYNINNLTTIQLVGKNSPHPNVQPYHGAYKNFAPAIGMSWAVKGGDGIGRVLFGQNKTVVRAGYSIAYERFTQVLFDQLWGYSAPGLLQQNTFSPPSYMNLTQAFLPLVPTGQPLTTVPINDSNSSTQTILSIDSGIKQPYVQNWSASIGRELARGLLLDVRYVASKGSKLLRGTNINELNIFENGILQAFQTTMAGGNSPLLNQIFNGLNIPSVGVVNGTTITGSQAMRTNSTLFAYLASNNVGGFANFLQYNTFVTGVRGGLIKNGGLPPNFAVANPQFGSDYLIGNFSNSTYNSLQVEVNKRFAHGFQIQGSYVFSKALSDYDGTSQSETANFITLRNEHLDKRLVSFDRPNVINLNGIWDLPFGPKQKFLGSSHGVLAHVVERWEAAAIFSKTSGSPGGFSVGSSGGTINGGGPTPVLLGQLPSGSPYISGNNVMYFTGMTQIKDPSIAAMPANIQSQSTLLAITGPNGFTLEHPVAGQAGPLSPTNYRGLGSYTFNVDVSKPVVLNYEHNIVMTFRADAINILNKPIWSTPSLNVDSTSFGLITSAGGARSVNLTLRLVF
ncbi:MAG TPA: TonB-dependent receptor, partial [Verrucomicrobiae bacterium]|nr:TonB-dependent receptor [Verrucomicrobiae bacterium]